MRLLYPFGLVDGPLDLVIGAFKAGFLLRPYGQDDLDRLAQALQAFSRLRIGVAVGTVLVLVPARANDKIEATVAEGIDGAGHFGEKRGVAIAVTGHYLTNAHAFRVARQGSGAGPALESHFLAGHRNGVEMIVEPD